MHAPEKNHLKMCTVDIICETCTVALRILLPYKAIKRVSLIIVQAKT